MVILKLPGSKLLACKIRIFGIKEIITKHKLKKHFKIIKQVIAIFLMRLPWQKIF